MDFERHSFVQCQKTHETRDVPFLRRKRYFLGFMVFMGMVIVNEMATNFGIVIVDITSAKNVTAGDEIITKEPEFKWTPLQKGILISCQACAFILGFAAGLLGKKFGGSRVFGLATFLSGVFSMFSPAALKLSLPVFFILRIMEGVFHIMVCGSFLEIFLKWAPARERFRLADFSFSGVLMGIIITFPICGLIIEKLGWPYVFYFSGSAAILWYIVWVILIYDDPSEDKFISEEEKFFIIANAANLPTKTKNPWRKILTSKAVLAYLNERFVEAWSVSFAIQCLPSYIKDSFDISISQVGFISCAPHVCCFFGLLIGGPIADVLRNRKILPPPKVYTLLITIGQLTSVVSFLMMALWTNFVGSVICICLLRFMYGIAESAYLVLPIDIVGEYASLVHGLGISVFAVGAVLNPICLSFIVPNQSTAEWCHYFLFLSAFNIWGLVIFYFYGSGRLEPWIRDGKNSKSIELT